MKDRSEFLRRVRRYRTDPRGSDRDIGCILLNEPFFFPELLWVQEREDLHRNSAIARLAVSHVEQEYCAGRWILLAVRGPGATWMALVLVVRERREFT